MLTELADWVVTGIVGGKVRVIASFPQSHVQDAVRLVRVVAVAKHADVEPSTWVFCCRTLDGRSVTVFRVAPDGSSLVAMEEFPGGLAAPSA